MTLTTAQYVRVKIQDAPLLANDTYYGDGMASAYTLPHRNITTASAYVLNNGTWTATAATFNVSGSVTFSGVISAGSAFRTNYTYSVFSDEEIGTFLTAGGASINGAAIEACQALMFDGLKRARWSSPDGSTYDDTAAQRALADLYKALKEEQAADSVSSGGFESWSVNQELY